ncbi:hypothetical protein Tco_0742528 [Tanacetum coccineum]
MSIRPETPVPLPSEAEVERLLALPIPPTSPLTPLSSPLPQIPSPPLPPPPSSLHLPPHVPTSLPLPLSLLPPLPTSLFIPPVDCREDTPEAELPPHKRLCLNAPAPRQTQIYQRVDILAEDRQFHYKTARLLDQEALVSREAWAHSIGLSTANNIPPKRTSAAARAVAATAAAAAAAAPITAAAVEQLIKARMSAALSNHETL